MLAMILAVATGCQDEPVDTRLEDHFKELTELGVYDSSSSLFLYDENVAQYAVSSRYNTTRIQNDDKVKFVRIAMDAAPETGNTVSVSITRKGIADNVTIAKDLRVIKIENQKIWFMDDEDKFCYLMPWE